MTHVVIDTRGVTKINNDLYVLMYSPDVGYVAGNSAEPLSMLSTTISLILCLQKSDAFTTQEYSSNRLMVLPPPHLAWLSNMH